MGEGRHYAGDPRPAPPEGPRAGRPGAGADGGDHRRPGGQDVIERPRASQGYDAGKRVKGRKQHIATDTLGLLLAVVITAASVQDTNGGKAVTARLAGSYPTVTAGWVDGR